MGLAILAAPALSKGEQIRFSRPAKEIAAPSKPDENLPETQSKRVDFSAPGIPAPVIQQQTIIRLPPREEDEDEEDRFSTRGSRRSTDPRRERDGAAGKNLLTPREAFPRDRWRGEPSGPRPEMERALSPVMEFDWDARETSTYQDSSRLDKNAPGDRTMDRKRGAMANREPYGFQNEVLPSSPLSDLFSSRPKEKPGRELLDRRAAFEQMLNPGASIAGRPPGSLEPVPAVPVPNTATPLGVPVFGATAFNPKSADPRDTFNVRDRLHNPMLEDIGKKYSSPSVKPPSSAIDSRLQSPLSRQPTTREFPARKF